MSSYGLWLAASLLFYVAGTLHIISGKQSAVLVSIGLGCALFSIVLNRRKKQN